MEYWSYYLDNKNKKRGLKAVSSPKHFDTVKFNTNGGGESYKYIVNGRFQPPPISWEECRQGNLENQKHFYKTGEFRTLFYYGGKVSFQSEFEKIFMYLKDSLGCSKFLDGFCGSGILSILASKLGYDVYMNDGLDLVVNYHKCLKDYNRFYQFMVLVDAQSKRFKYLTKDEVVRELLKLNGESVPLSSATVTYKGNKPVFSANLMRTVTDEEIDKLYATYKVDIEKFIKQKNKEYNEQRRQVYWEIADLIDGHIFKWYTEDGWNAYFKGKRKKKEFTEAQKKEMLYWYEYDARPNLKWAVLYYIYRYYTFYGNSSFSPGRETVIHNLLDLVNIQQYYKNINITRSYYKKFISKDLFNSNAVVMLDPPYRDETRVEQGAYKTFEFTEKQHRYFLEYISQPGIKAKILVCGYTSSFYDRRLHKYNLEKGCTWQKVRILKAGRADRGARECLWVNFDFKPIIDLYPNDFELIDEKDWDYRYLTKRKKRELREKYNISDVTENADEAPN